jgi:hypothetical protein
MFYKEFYREKAPWFVSVQFTAAFPWQWFKVGFELANWNYTGKCARHRELSCAVALGCVECLVQFGTRKYVGEEVHDYAPEP